MNVYYWPQRIYIKVHCIDLIEANGIVSLLHLGVLLGSDLSNPIRICL